MNKGECRACLQKVDEEDIRDLFREWNTPWALPGAQVADDLARLADVEISDLDGYSKVICAECYHRLEDTCSFLIMVQRSDCALRSPGLDPTYETERDWHGPLPVVKQNGNVDNNVEVEVKQEVLSDDEYGSNHMEQDWEPQLDIKIEPEEIIAPAITVVQSNGTYSSNDVTTQKTSSQCDDEEASNKYQIGKQMDVVEVKLLGDVQRNEVPSKTVACLDVSGLSSFLNMSGLTENIPISISDVSGILRDIESQDHNQITQTKTNAEEKDFSPSDESDFDPNSAYMSDDDIYLENSIKQEPLSDAESEPVPDLPLDCLLCMKAFHSVTGLKAHVIAHHSYGTVMRKTDDSTVTKENSELFCATCRESFQTRTDLMVHETCHGKHACFVCGAKFNTFRQLSRHGARCRPRQSVAADAERTRPPARPQKISQSNNNSSTKTEPTKVEPLPKRIKRGPSAGKISETTKTELKKNKDNSLTEKLKDKPPPEEKRDILSIDKPIEEERVESVTKKVRDKSVTEVVKDKLPSEEIRERLSTEEIKPSNQETSNEKVTDQQSNKEIDVPSTNGDTDEPSIASTLICTQPMKTDVLKTQLIPDAKDNIKATSPIFVDSGESTKHFQDLLSFEQDSIHSSIETDITETTNQNYSDETCDQQSEKEAAPETMEVAEMDTSCDPELTAIVKSISLRFEDQSALNSPSDDNSNLNPTDNIPSEEISQNMEVHLAINPLNKDSLLLEDKMDIEQMESVISDSVLPLVNVISEIADENVIQ